MNTNTEQQLIEKWRNLPLDKQQQVLEFVESLKEQKSEVKQRPFGLCKGEFTVPDDFNEPLPDEILMKTLYTQLVKLPSLHRDPFDRLLMCQALENDLLMVTEDKAVLAYSMIDFLS